MIRMDMLNWQKLSCLVFIKTYEVIIKHTKQKLHFVKNYKSYIKIDVCETLMPPNPTYQE